MYVGDFILFISVYIIWLTDKSTIMDSKDTIAYFAMFDFMITYYYFTIIIFNHLFIISFIC